MRTLQQEAPTASIGTVTAAAPWDFPEEPEEGWEKRLITKEIECEAEPTAELLEVKQYEEDVERVKKRKRQEESEDGPSKHRSRIRVAPVAGDDVIIEADMYGDAAVLTKIVGQVQDVEDLEDGELAETRVLQDDPSQGDLPELGEVGDLPLLEPGSAHLSRPGAIIAFKHMEMINFRPSFSKYKTARILRVEGEELILRLATRDVQEPMYDYEGERVPGPFDLLDGQGEPITGQIIIHRGELMDPLLVSA